MRRYMRGMLSGRLSDAAADARHARFAAACAINALLEETPAWQVGSPDFSPGIFSDSAAAIDPVNDALLLRGSASTSSFPVEVAC